MVHGNNGQGGIMINRGIFHNDFQVKPWWWEAYEPKAFELADVPTAADVAIVGAGYAGICAALELAKNNIHAVVFDAAQPGFGGSTRNGGMVSGGRNVGKRYLGTSPADEEKLKSLRNHAADGFDLVERLIDEEGIDCGWHKTGVFVGAWCRKHLEDMVQKVANLNEVSPTDAFLVQPSEQREHIGSDYYRGGMVSERAAHLHPALYFKGLLDACIRRGVIICAEAGVKRLTQSDAGWRVETDRGVTVVKDVMIATNGYTGDVTPQLKRRVVPVGSYMIATEELPDDLARSISPLNRSFADSRRVLTYYRMSPDGKRLLFGGRAKFGQTEARETAPILYRFMVDRFPQLKDSKITHAWTGNVAFTMDEVAHMGTMEGMHYAMGCNGSGVAMMSYLGTQTARKIAGVANEPCAFDSPVFPTHPLYNGNPWFIPWVGRYFRMRDWIDRRFN